jgi:hypothetical protein
MRLVVVTGGRDFTDREFVSEVLTCAAPTHLIHGCARGADTLCGNWAKRRGIPCIEVPANWKAHGKAAGPLRNGWMLDLNPIGLVAFPGGRGTADMIRQAQARGIKVYAPSYEA